MNACHSLCDSDIGFCVWRPGCTQVAYGPGVGCWQVRLLRTGPVWLVQALVSLISLLCFNRFVLW